MPALVLARLCFKLTWHNCLQCFITQSIFRLPLLPVAVRQPLFELCHGADLGCQLGGHQRRPPGPPGLRRPSLPYLLPCLVLYQKDVAHNITVLVSLLSLEFSQFFDLLCLPFSLGLLLEAWPHGWRAYFVNSALVLVKRASSCERLDCVEVRFAKFTVYSTFDYRKIIEFNCNFINRSNY